MTDPTNFIYSRSGLLAESIEYYLRQNFTFDTDIMLIECVIVSKKYVNVVFVVEIVFLNMAKGILVSDVPEYSSCDYVLIKPLAF